MLAYVGKRASEFIMLESNKKVNVAISCVGLSFFVWFFFVGSWAYKILDNDGTSNNPLLLEEYLKSGGNWFDYYLGYSLMTFTGDMYNVDDFPFPLHLKNHFVGIFFHLVHFWIPFLISILLVLFNLAEEKEEDKISSVSAVGVKATAASWAVFLWASYLFYYSIVYIFNFWLK
ncbi:MAG: hypothetical protein HGA61_00465 [Candidatus Moranbacteria bacterium]|nr:hypothetical protein [Candidatus Moranbacteria bacterium]